MSSAALLSWRSTVRDLEKLSAAYTDVSRSSLESTSWPRDLSHRGGRPFSLGLGAEIRHAIHFSACTAKATKHGRPY